jgi:hypothetical protein
LKLSAFSKQKKAVRKDKTKQKRDFRKYMNETLGTEVGAWVSTAR